MFVILISWIVAGSIVGFIASKNVKLHGDDPKLGIAAAVVGAVAGGILHRIFSTEPIVGFNIWNALFATLGAVVVAVVWHFMRSRAARA